MSSEPSEVPTHKNAAKNLGRFKAVQWEVGQAGVFGAGQRITAHPAIPDDIQAIIETATH